MKRKLLVIVLGILFWVGFFAVWQAYMAYKWRSPYLEEQERFKHESKWERASRFRSQSDFQARVALTNRVVGLNRIISFTTDTTNMDPNFWRGEASVEFVNSMGGITRTNLGLKFFTTEGEVPQLLCMATEADRK